MFFSPSHFTKIPSKVGLLADPFGLWFEFSVTLRLVEFLSVAFHLLCSTELSEQSKTEVFWRHTAMHCTACLLLQLFFCSVCCFQDNLEMLSFQKQFRFFSCSQWKNQSHILSCHNHSTPEFVFVYLFGKPDPDIYGHWTFQGCPQNKRLCSKEANNTKGSHCLPSESVGVEPKIHLQR